jgi:hypothetical protein
MRVKPTIYFHYIPTLRRLFSHPPLHHTYYRPPQTITRVLRKFRKSQTDRHRFIALKERCSYSIEISAEDSCNVAFVALESSPSNTKNGRKKRKKRADYHHHP